MKWGMGRSEVDRRSANAALDKAILEVLRRNVAPFNPERRLPVTLGDLTLVLVNMRVSFTGGRLDAALQRLRKQGLIARSTEPASQHGWIFVEPKKGRDVPRSHYPRAK